MTRRVKADFEELLTLVWSFAAAFRQKGRSGVTLKNDYTGEFLQILPFRATGAQVRAISEAARDMERDEPMNRLIQGGVGSGKTAVAAALVYSAAKNGVQSALMAPTEILASQHFRTLRSF